MGDDIPNLIEISKVKGTKGVPAKTKVRTPNTQGLNRNERGHSFKSGKYAVLESAHCDTCYLRDEDAGGSGQCTEYEAGAVCSIDKDLKRIIDKFDTRNPEDIKEIVNETTKDLLLRVKKSVIQANFDGNFVDKTYLANQAALMNNLRIATDLNNRVGVTMTQTEKFNESGDLQEIGRTLRAEMLNGDK